MTIECSTTPYKKAFVQLQIDQNYDWFITIGIGFCPPDDEVIKRLTIIDAILSKKYLVARYHKLPPEHRFLTGLAFEGERDCGSRHAHILVRIPTPMKKCTRGMLLSAFPFEFQFLWHTLNPSADPAPWSPTWPKVKGKTKPLDFYRADVAQTIYTVELVQSVEQDWSRFEIIQPARGATFSNENLSVIQNRGRQKRAALCLAYSPASSFLKLPPRIWMTCKSRPRLLTTGISSSIAILLGSPTRPTRSV
jgi:hypothetical protein